MVFLKEALMLLEESPSNVVVLRNKTLCNLLVWMYVLLLKLAFFRLEAAWDVSIRNWRKM